MPSTQSLRNKMRAHNLADDAAILDHLKPLRPTAAVRTATTARAVDLVTAIREHSEPALMEVFLAEYGLSTDEGVALMCLAEALLRVPDADTIDALIEDKIAPSAWGEHLGHSSSSLVNASTWALMLTGKVLNDDDSSGVAGVLRGAVRRLGEPVIRVAVDRAIKEMGHQFVLGRTIKEALSRGEKRHAKGYTFSYDMLGEAALTAKDAAGFFEAYANAIKSLAATCTSTDIRENPGISIKLSALHPRYEVGQKGRVMDQLVARVLILAKMAKDAGMGLNIDAEEADRLDLSMDVIEAVLKSDDLAGWDGFGVVVQAYGKRASWVLDWLHQLATDLDRRIMVRLVKGAYWDTEIKRAQVEGLSGFPVFSTKAATDVSYICCAHKLLRMTDRIYPQFATHNAQTVAAILEMASDVRAFEFQRLHGMGEALHDIVMNREGSRCRIYAPVGAHRDLLAYLVRRLLENGANSSFVNQIVDEAVPAAVVAKDPMETVQEAGLDSHAVAQPADIFGSRRNSQGFDLHDVVDLAQIDAARNRWKDHTWVGKPLLAVKSTGKEKYQPINPANPNDVVGKVTFANAVDVSAAAVAAKPWSDASPKARADILRKAADLYEDNFGELFALLAREAGKTPMDAIAELREAVDFLRFYASEAERLGDQPARGIIGCVSPWNFPLAIFTGQLSAALAAGNAVLAKPAEATSLIACRAVELLYKAGVPRTALQLMPGLGADVGAALTSATLDGVCFTGSTLTAQRINRAMAQSMAPTAPLIAETGGLNAMIVDSTALPEQAVRDIIASSFQSAGQRCSALRVLYLQEDIAKPFLEMLYGAMDEQVIGDPWNMVTDIGPVIDSAAKSKIVKHIEAARSQGRLLKEMKAPQTGTFVAPTVIKVTSIRDLSEETFGPVLHVATYKASKLQQVIDDVNASGFGLTFGLHTRIDTRVQEITAQLKVGNIYVNRNQIGAVVGSQPFGGEGLSGTGPKAGGPAYVARFYQAAQGQGAGPQLSNATDVQAMLDRAAQKKTMQLGTEALPGPTGESNQLSQVGRGVVLCMGPSVKDADRQAAEAVRAGCWPVIAAVDADGLANLTGFDAVVSWSDAPQLRELRGVLAGRDGPIIPLIADADIYPRLVLERHVCVDTTAAGGNAALLAESV